MKIKVAEATNTQLDYLVAQCEGFIFEAEFENSKKWVWGVWGENPDGRLGYNWKFNYSTDWAQGGPIIEREGIATAPLLSGLILAHHPTFKEGDVWGAEIGVPDSDDLTYSGPTLLIAAMRCFVASKLGDEVEVPEELE